jgi:DNA-binding beta-propeller fold protein YncE
MRDNPGTEPKAMADSDRRSFLRAALFAGPALIWFGEERGQGIRPAARARRATVTTVAGTGSAGYEAEGEAGLPALSTPIDDPYGAVVGPDGALYFCEVGSGRTRRLDLTTNRLTTIAGNGNKAYAGDGGPALAASFSAPHEIRFDTDGNLFVVERDAHVVRRIDARTRRVSTVSGTGTAGFTGDGGAATAAQLRQPHSIAFDATGNLLICDIGNGRVRSLDSRTGILSTLVGTGERLDTPDDAPFDGTPLRGPRSLDTDPRGNAYLVLREGNAVFRLDLRARRLQRIAGTGETGYGGDGGPALAATFNGPKGIAYSAPEHALYIVDTENHAIRRMNLTTNTIETVLGTGERGDGPDGDPLTCKLNRPHGVFVHQGTIFVTDSENHRIRALQVAF